jgi:hypothetical protein
LEVLNCPKDDWQAVVLRQNPRAQKRTEQQENAKKAADKTQAKAVMDANRQARRRAKRKFLIGLRSSRRLAICKEEQKLLTERTDAKQKLLRERQAKYLEELALKHDLQQLEGRYIKAPCYLKAASKKEAAQLYRKEAMEMAAEMMKAGTLADSAGATKIEEQVTQDWKNRYKLSKKMQRS